MISLIQNEWMKIFKRPGTYVMVFILLLAASVFSAVLKYENSGIDKKVDKNWEQTLNQENSALRNQMNSSGSSLEKNFYQKQITLNSYRIKHHIPPETSYSVWNFVNDASQLIELAGLFTIIIAAGIVASEFNWGTVKLLLIRPISRTKVLLSKYLTVILFALLMLTILFLFSTAVGALLFGLPDQTPTYLNYFNGKVSEQNMIIHLLIYYGMSSINMLMLATMAFMISSVFRNNSLAIGLSIFLMFTGGQLTQLLALRFSWVKYILFANTDLMQYYEGKPMVEGMTLTFSILMLFIYFFLFHVLAFSVFRKRDVAA